MKGGVKTAEALDITNVAGSMDNTFEWCPRVIRDGIIKRVSWKDRGGIVRTKPIKRL